MSAFGPSAQASAHVRSYDEAEAYLAAKGVDSRKICGNNTYVERREHGDIAIRLHQTDIITFQAGLSPLIVLNTGGWHSQITKQRLEQFLPAPLTIFSFRGQWRVGLSEGQRWAQTKGDCGNSVIFTDGLRLIHNTVGWEPLNALSPEDEQQLDAAKKALDNAIKRYLTHVDTKVAEWKVELTEKNSLSPAGDPWCCAMGIGGSDNEHLWQHLREGYVFLTILRKAYEDSGRYRDPIQRLLMDIQFGSGDLKRELRKYLLKHLDPALSVRAEQERAAKCVEYAEEALTRPSDFGYFGDDESMWVTSAPTFGRNRDSENVEIANYEIVWENLVEKFPDLVKTDQDRKDENPGGIYIFGASHWACGWVEQIVVPVLKRPGAVTSDNIHPAFIEICEAVEAIRLYPALPGAEERAAKMDHDDIVKDIAGWQAYLADNKGDPFINAFTAEQLARESDDGYDWSSEGVLELHARACWQDSLVQVDGQGALL